MRQHRYEAALLISSTTVTGAAGINQLSITQFQIPGHVFHVVFVDHHVVLIRMPPNGFSASIFCQLKCLRTALHATVPAAIQ